MFSKERSTPTELRYFRYLRARINFSEDEKQYYLNLEKGFEGELQFDRWLKKALTADCLILNDLLLDHNRSLFQIDSLLMFQNVIYLIDVKNFEGNFYLDNQQWHYISGKESKNPLLQMKRAESLFRQWLQKYGFTYTINGRIVFVHPEFYLYNASSHLPLIFPNQLPRFSKQLNDTPSKTSQKHKRLAELLISNHISESPNARIPDYDYLQLKKGVVCARCYGFLTSKVSHWVCDACGYKEKHQDAVLRAVNEFKFLFPDKKLTTKAIYDWCALKGDKRTIRFILLKHFDRIGYGSSSHFV
ncbi:nuclease-related domain-containing protein [Salicibibacter kimchii]|uniref:NERD domain-containing protein n=1 Tax=Salicibibacter kimchii TaxID=2099786 RepID=A0A345BX48_9BACI|nr:nuclease-related domain-containing protein [Salicibibacter kimchii]AXF55529.1 NERD domain-containing protein [Salicibibacter kimchii]